MTPIAIFGVCVLITLMLISIPFFLVGNGFALILIILPALIVEGITGERGLDFGRKSFVYIVLLCFFILAQIALIALIFFGFYCFFWGYPSEVAAAPTLPATFDAHKHTLLVGINKILLLLQSYFLGMFIYQAIKYRDNFKNMNAKFMFQYQILPFLMFPMVFIFLIASLRYLTAHPGKDSIDTLPAIAGYLYAAYLIYAFIRTIYFYARNVRHGFTEFKFIQFLQLFITITYDITFLYFFLQLYSAMII
jgi:hypothetical protein